MSLLPFVEWQVLGRQLRSLLLPARLLACILQRSVPSLLHSPLQALALLQGPHLERGPDAHNIHPAANHVDPSAQPRRWEGGRSLADGGRGVAAWPGRGAALGWRHTTNLLGRQQRHPLLSQPLAGLPPSAPLQARSWCCAC